MNNMFYTKKGDKGKTNLFGRKDRVYKSSLQIEALGELDELNSLIGVYKNEFNKYNSVRKILEQIQQDLFVLQAEVAGAEKKLGKNALALLEKIIAEESRNLKIGHFIVPGASRKSALLDHLRTAARRVERRIVALSKSKKLSPDILAYLNRLSSLFYVLARKEAQKRGKKERRPDY